MTHPPDVFDQVVAALQPLLDRHGFAPAQRMDGGLLAGTRHAAFAAGGEAVRLVWEESGGYVVLEALEPEFGGTWTDLLLKFIDLRSATPAELAYLVETVREELTLYIDEVAGTLTVIEPRNGAGYVAAAAAQHSFRLRALPSSPRIAMPDIPHDRGAGGGKRITGIVLLVFAAILLIGFVQDPDVAGALIVALPAVGGGLLYRAGAEDAERARQTAIGELQLQVLELAKEDGRLTVTEVASRLRWTVPQAKAVLDSLDDGLRVWSRPSDEGVMVYEFREIIHDPDQPRLASHADPPPIPRAESRTEPPPIPRAEPSP